MLESHHSIIESITRMIDALLIALSLCLVIFIYDGQWDNHDVIVILFSAIIAPIILEQTNAYRRWRTVSFWSELQTLLLAWLGIIITLICFAFITQMIDKFTPMEIAWWGILSFTLLVLNHGCRRILSHYARKKGKNIRRAVIIGSGTLAHHVAEKITTSPWMGIEVLGFFDDVIIEIDNHQNILLGTILEAVEYIKSHQVQLVYLALPLSASEKAKQLIYALQNTTAAVYFVPDIFMFELLHTKINDVDGIPILALCDPPFTGTDGVLKRIFDVIISVLILLFIWPLLLFIAMIIKCNSSGPVIFKQTRYGLNGSSVTVWKFRTMAVSENTGDIQQAIKNDPRVTTIGQFLRQSSLDELPQFINVLQGRMSIVGPRPHAVAHNEYYRTKIQAYMWRHKVKPGITGWAQINGWRGETDTLHKMEKRIEYDLWYIRHWSLYLDIKIIWRTIMSELIRKSDNAY